MNFHKNYYKILGVQREATREQLKSAYRKLVMKYHPDRNPNDAEAEDKIKEINEAFEILDSDINRFVYDQYKEKEEKINKKQKASTTESSKPAPKTNRRTYEQKKTIRKEHRVYVMGSITIRYWAEQENDPEQSVMKEVRYLLNPVSAEALITRSDIHDFIVPNQFQKAYKEAQLFKTPLPQYTKCRITADNQPDEYYDLYLQDIRVIDPILTNITKHEKQSLGTLKGTFYAYVLSVVEEEVTESVTECFGETGKTETKAEGTNNFYRVQYYHIDCTTYWGPWTPVIENGRTATSSKRKTHSPVASVTSNQGCLQYLWIPVLFTLLIAWPHVILVLLAFFLLGWLLYLSRGLIRTGLSILSVLLPLFLIFAAFNTGQGNNTIRRNSRPSYDTIKSTRKALTGGSSAGNDDKKADTLINHYISWKDYDSNSYTIILSVKISDIKAAALDHNMYEPAQFYTTLGPVYNYLESSDQARLDAVYKAFDSVKKANVLSSTEFAGVVVSCIQSIPYYLVVDKSCNADYSDDDFIVNYLEHCNNDCCVGNIKYGVRSPVEFLSDLKGDCDTRSLLIYSILKKFNYNVALLTSRYYKHALVAVNFDNKYADGLAMSINNNNYYLWETTSSGFRPGQIPASNQNLSYWEIALLNEKK